MACKDFNVPEGVDYRYSGGLGARDYYDEISYTFDPGIMTLRRSVPFFVLYDSFSAMVRRKRFISAS